MRLILCYLFNSVMLDNFLGVISILFNETYPLLLSAAKRLNYDLVLYFNSL